MLDSLIMDKHLISYRYGRTIIFGRHSGHFIFPLEHIQLVVAFPFGSDPTTGAHVLRLRYNVLYASDSQNFPREIIFLSLRYSIFHEK